MAHVVITDRRVKIECVANHDELIMLENVRLWIFITFTVKCVKGNSFTLAGPISHYGAVPYVGVQIGLNMTHYRRFQLLCLIFNY
jgi:hypothetical protein